jgi:hypothetical protein
MKDAWQLNPLNLTRGSPHSEASHTEYLLHPGPPAAEMLQNLAQTYPFPWLMFHTALSRSSTMLKVQLAADLAATTLMAGTALAQTATPARPAGPGQVMTKMSTNLMRRSQLIGIDVYGTPVVPSHRVDRANNGPAGKHTLGE